MFDQRGLMTHLFRERSQALLVAITSFLGSYATAWGLNVVCVIISGLSDVVAYLLRSRQLIAGLIVRRV
jgi:hypothetical protein